MKKIEKLILNVENDKEITKAISKLNYYNAENFVKDAQRYINAIKSGRMINAIGHISSSGMSRSIKFVSIEKNKRNNLFQMCNFFQLFKALGYTESRARGHYFIIGGCGMDMIFNTNYSIIHRLHHLGFINKEQCSKLAQMTPQTI